MAHSDFPRGRVFTQTRAASFAKSRLPLNIEPETSITNTLDNASGGFGVGQETNVTFRCIPFSFNSKSDGERFVI